MPYTNEFKDMTDADPKMILKAQQILVTDAVKKQIFCPFTKKVLDKKRTVVVIPVTGRQIVIDAALWDERHEDVVAAAPSGVEVYDGRELWS